MPKADPSPSEFLDKAQEPLGAARVSAAEGFSDDAISRAYFSMFHPARAMPAAKGKYAATHHGVLTLVGQPLVKTGEINRELIGYAETRVEQAERRIRPPDQRTLHEQEGG